MGKRKYESVKEVSTKKTKSEENKVESIDTVDAEQPQIQDASEEEQIQPSKGQRFHIKQFRKEIAGKIGQTTALTQFLQVCLSPETDVDYMLEYLKAGGNSHEILRQIGTDSKKNLSLATPTFHLFHLIILKVQSSLPHMITITEEACRYFLNTFMSTVEIMISENSGPRHRKIILKLLTSMVTLNPDLGVEVLNQAPLTPKHLQYILEKTNYKEKDNVRTSFVHFMTSFLVDSHLPLIKALLEKQGLLSLVIPGLIQDDGEAVMMFLNILKKNVIDNTFISKSLKLKTFSHQVLHNLFKIYSWRGPPELSTESKTEMCPLITELLSNILLTLFTSHKQGLYFMDTSLGTSDANKNQNLYKALLTLKRPWENEVECEVILEIVYKCPDLHRAIITIVEHSFEPQHSPIWEKTTEFVIKLLNKLKPEELVPKMSKLSPSQVANFIRFITLPVPLLKFISIHIGKDETISFYCVKILVKMLDTLRRYMRILELENSQARVVELRNKLEYFFPKHLPVPGAVVNIIQDVINGKTQEEIKQGYKLPKPEATDSLVSLVDLLLLYNEVHPAYFETVDGNLDMKKLLNFSKTLSNGPVSVLKFKIVSLWLILDSSAISIKNPMFKELFLIMLEVYMSDDDEIWIEAKDILCKFFKNTSIFEADEDEIQLMLYSLRNANLNPPSIIGDIIEYVLSNIKDISEFIRNQIVHFEISDEKSEANLDKLLNDLMANKTTDDSVFLEHKTPSSFIVGSIQYTLNNSDKKKSLKQFLCVYVANLLHSNYSPELTEILIGDAKLDVRSYVGNWITKPVPIPDTVIGKDKVLNNLSKALIGNEEISISDVFPFLKKSDEEVDLTLNEASYIVTVDQYVDSSELLIWSKYLVFCLVRLTELGQLDDDAQKKISDYFECLIAFGKKRHLLDSCRAIIMILFKNPYFLKVYSPLEESKNSSHTLATKFLMQIVLKHKTFVEHLNKIHRILKPYQQKNFNELVKAFIKLNKKKNIKTEHTTQVLKVIGLSDDDVKEILNNVFNANVDSFVKDDKDPTLALDVLMVIVERYSSPLNNNLSEENLKKIVKLYTDLVTNKEVTPNLTKLETALIQFFENKPHEVKHVSEDDFRKFFHTNTVRKTTAQLAAVLLTLNGKLCNVFKDEITRPEILSQRELTLPLGEAAINHNQFLMDNTDFLNNVFSEYKSNIIKLLEKPHKAGQIYIGCWSFVRKLILECMDAEDCKKLFSKIQKFEAAELSHVSFFEAAFLKLLISGKKIKKEHVVNFLMSMMNLTLFALKEGKDEKTVQRIIVSIYTAIEIATETEGLDLDRKEDFQKVTEAAIWQNFCKSILKDSLKVRKADQNNLLGPQLLFVLTALVKLFYPKNHEEIATLFDMVTSHSEFLNVMLSHHSTDIKSRLIEFLILLISKNESVMKNQHIPVYLSAYRATRSPCDKLILYLLYFYETHGVPVNEYKPYVWGDSAANHYAVRKNKTASLWAHPTPNQVLNLFDKDTIERTVRNFPVTQKLEYNYELPPNIDANNNDLQDECIRTILDKMFQDGAFKSVNKDIEGQVRNERLKAKYSLVIPRLKGVDLVGESHVRIDESIYDPGFVFPLLSHLLAPGSVASCFKLLRTGLLSLPVMALSSSCPLMRAAAYHVLHRFCMLLETETRHKNDKLLLSDYIETLRHSLSTAIYNVDGNAEDLKQLKNPRLPAIDALYLARALMVSTAPFDPLYKPVNNFLIAKQFVDLTLVPDFLNLFHDSDVESADRRMWIIDVIKDGTKTMTDVNVVFKTMCLKMIMDFYSSVLSDKKAKEKILGAVGSIVAIPRAFDILNEGYGLMSWLHSVIRHLGHDKSFVKRILSIIENIIYSCNVNSFARYVVGGKNQNAKTIDELQELRANKDAEQEVVVMLLDLGKYVDVLEMKDVAALIRVFKLLNKKTIKCLPKRQIKVLLKHCSDVMPSCENIKLLTDALVSNDASMLKSKNINFVSEKCIDIEQNECLIKELTELIQTYLA